MTRSENLQLDLSRLGTPMRAQREGGAHAPARAREKRRWFGAGTDAPRESRVKSRAHAVNLKARLYLVLMLLALGSAGLIVRAVDLQWVRKDFYQDQGDQRYTREIPIEVPRGTIFDRNGEPLAVSTPV
ncbi:MAG: penicillin-binding protein 2, partial [Gammaproteobacteria bacterium]